MGMAKKEESASPHITFEAFKINPVLSVDKIQRILAQNATKILRHVDIGMIYGWLYEYGIARLGEAADDEGYTGYYTGYEVEPLRLYGPSITALLPCHD